MPVRKKASLVGLALYLLSAPAVRALDKEAKKWLDEVKPIMLPEEEKTYRDLKDKNDVAEFQRIFWARRDPDLETPANEYEAEYQKARADADSRYRIAGTPGSQTDCGRVFILLGPPDDVKKGDATDAAIPRRGPTATAPASSSVRPGRSSSASTRPALCPRATAWASSSTVSPKER